MYRCKDCKDTWLEAKVWMMSLICPKCGSTNVEEFPKGEIYTYQKGSSLDFWWQKVKKYVKKSE